MRMLDILILIFGVPAFTLFLDECMDEGEIFQLYGRWVKKEMRYNETAEVKIHEPRWKKPIGGCVYCTTPYMIFFFTLFFVLDFYKDYTWLTVVHGLLYLFAVVGLSNTFLRTLNKYT